jgi:hypothetical protein
MQSRRRELLPWVLWALAGVAVLGWLGLVGFAWNDYDDEASAAVQALREGDVGRFLALSPAYGGSLVLRAPFALAANLWGGGELAAYRMLALPCLLAAAGFGVWLVARMHAVGRDRLARGVALGLVVANPIALRALEIGHPEELLAAVLCVAALLAAGGRRTLLAGVLLGLAIATKAWALVAFGPVVLAAPLARGRIAVIAVAVAAVAYAPFLTQPSSAIQTARVATETGVIFQPWQAGWFLGEHTGVVRSMDGIKPGYRTPPAWLSPISHPLIVLGAAALSLLWWRRRRGAGWQEALLLLALLLHLRCLLDPFNTVYYCLPFLLVMLAWECLATRRLPVVALGATAAAWVTFQVAPTELSADAQALVYLAWAVPLAAALTLRAFAPERVRAPGHTDDQVQMGLLPLRSAADH